MGDAGAEIEEDLIQKYNLKDIDVLKVGHHGSKTSSSKEFIDETNPKYSIISVGKNNRYGHPNKEVLNVLGGTMPEDLSTPEKSLKELEKESKKLKE